jgi:hypothetical protein
VLENKVLSGIFGPKREEVAGDWRRLDNEELHNVYASPNIIRVVRTRRMRGAVHVACIGEMRNAYKIVVRKPEGKRQHGRPSHSWEGDISMDLRKIGWKGVYCSYLVQKWELWWALVNKAMNLRVLCLAE